MDHLLPTRYRLDGQNGSTPWWNFQTDGWHLAVGPSGPQRPA